MDKRRLGHSGLEVSPLCFGGNVFGWTIDEQKSFEILDAFTGAGLNFIDTADVYSRWKPGNKGGESETILGNWLKKSGKRDQLIIATKVGSDMGEGKQLKKEYIIAKVEGSLRRLQIESIDLYQSHFDDLLTPVEETLEAYDTLLKQGKIKAIGASNFSAERLQESLEASQAKGYPSYISYQPEYNLYNREGFEKEHENICVQNNIGVISYFSLASGFLTGKYRTKDDLGKSARGGDMDKHFNERGFRILKALDEVSAAFNSTPASVALAWLIARPSITAPIASATSVEQVNALVAATELKLDAEAIEKLTIASNK